MHRAPALALECLPDRSWQRFHRGLAVLSLATLFTWLVWHVRMGDADWWLILPLAAAGAGAVMLPLMSLHRAARPGSWLLWLPDLGLWQFGPPGLTSGMATGTADCLLDLGDWLLLRHTTLAAPGNGFRPRTRWLPLSRRQHPAQWHALRCAVFSPGAARPAQAVPHER